MKILLTPRGNFTLAEAIDLFRGGRVPTMVARHYGLFAFNTVPEEQIDRVAQTTKDPRVFRARLWVHYRLTSSP